MGASKAKRAAKQRQRAAERKRTREGEHDTFDTIATADLLFVLGNDRVCKCGQDHNDRAEIVHQALQRKGDVEAVIVESLNRYVKLAWSNGWQPFDIFRFVLRGLSDHHGDLIRDAIAREADAYLYDGKTPVCDEWRRQLADLEADMWWSKTTSYLVQRSRRSACSERDVVDSAAELIVYLQFKLRKLPELMPPPGKASIVDLTNRNPSNDKMLTRIRALLAKAESTQFDEEADALVAKAQELMSRHAIDVALVEAASGTRVTPIGRRIPVDDPYASAKCFLLSEVSAANHCHTIWVEQIGSTTVMGFEQDVAHTEMLFTSLLVQATASMARHGSVRHYAGRSQTRSFRRSFLEGFAVRVGERLRDASADALKSEEAERGVNLLPVLATRDEDVKRLADELFPNVLTTSKSLGSNGAGFAAGQAAAEVAKLSPYQAVGS